MIDLGLIFSKHYFHNPFISTVQVVLLVNSLVLKFTIETTTNKSFISACRLAIVVYLLL